MLGTINDSSDEIMSIAFPTSPPVLDPTVANQITNAPIRDGKTGRRNPALDVLRSLAIIMVVNCHVAGTFAPAPDQSYSKVLQLGGIGVELFFVLSGWLLGRQLCLELADTGTIDVWRFWLR